MKRKNLRIARRIDSTTRKTPVVSQVVFCSLSYFALEGLWTPFHDLSPGSQNIISDKNSYTEFLSLTEIPGFRKRL